MNLMNSVLFPLQLRNEIIAQLRNVEGIIVNSVGDRKLRITPRQFLARNSEAENHLWESFQSEMMGQMGRSQGNQKSSHPNDSWIHECVYVYMNNSKMAVQFRCMSERWTQTKPNFKLFRWDEWIHEFSCQFSCLLPIWKIVDCLFGLTCITLVGALSHIFEYDQLWQLSCLYCLHLCSVLN